jgi:hypothetical protein
MRSPGHRRRAASYSFTAHGARSRWLPQCQGVDTNAIGADERTADPSKKGGPAQTAWALYTSMMGPARPPDPITRREGDQRGRRAPNVRSYARDEPLRPAASSLRRGFSLGSPTCERRSLRSVGTCVWQFRPGYFLHPKAHARSATPRTTTTRPAWPQT